MNGQELLRMGFTRVNFHYCFSEEDVDYILEAIAFISEFGWMFLPHYKFDQDQGFWVHREESEQKQRSWLGDIDYSSGAIAYKRANDPLLRGSFPFHQAPNCVPKLDSFVREAEKTLARTIEEYKVIYGKSEVDQRLLIQEEYQQLIWFLFPSQVLPLVLSLKYQSPLKFGDVERFAASLKPQHEEEWSTPYHPRDYNREKHKMQFSLEYVQGLIGDSEESHPSTTEGIEGDEGSQTESQGLFEQEGVKEEAVPEELPEEKEPE
mmetsp:Transcript_2682/g.4516  ORF Transcript_2682/g.4516 Transcript_2682/m.4516 type:complete len:264 (-) Transcript_2682:972-1763(-)